MVETLCPGASICIHCFSTFVSEEGGGSHSSFKNPHLGQPFHFHHFRTESQESKLGKKVESVLLDDKTWTDVYMNSQDAKLIVGPFCLHITPSGILYLNFNKQDVIT